MVLFVVALVLLIVGTVIGLMMMNSPKTAKATDKALEFPTTEIGVPIGVLFGTRLIKSAAIVAYFDLKIVKVKVSVKGKK